jgi:transcriptional regulator with XRE-family HTH domain
VTTRHWSQPMDAHRRARRLTGQTDGAAEASPAVEGSKGRRMNEPWDSQMEALGAFIRRQRQLANLSLRQLADRTKLSNPYLSQIERGLHQPSVRVIRLISDALNVSAETLLAHAGLLHHKDGGTEGADPQPVSVENAIQAESRLTDDQKNALIAVLRSMLPAE